MLRDRNSRSKTLKTCPRSGKQLRTEVWWPAMLWPKTTPSASRHVNLQIIGIGLIKYKEGQVCHVGRREEETTPLCLCLPPSSCPGAQPPPQYPVFTYCSVLTQTTWRVPAPQVVIFSVFRGTVMKCLPVYK